MRQITWNDIDFNIALVSIEIPYDEFIGRFGIRHEEHPKDWDAPGPVELWFFELPWGHKITLEYHLAISQVSVFMDCLEIDAVLSHIGLANHIRHLHTIEIQILAERHPELSSNLVTYSLHRLDDNGNTAVMHTYESRRVAEYYQRVYEARGHKQLYWVEQAKTAS